MRKIVTMAMLCTVATVGSAAQEPAAVAKQAAEANAIRAKLQVARVGVESRLTKNAPYSAEAVTESVQLLADGNRIVTKNTTHIFRDSEGRTRREQLNAAGHGRREREHHRSIVRDHVCPRSRVAHGLPERPVRRNVERHGQSRRSRRLGGAST